MQFKSSFSKQYKIDENEQQITVEEALLQNHPYFKIFVTQIVIFTILVLFTGYTWANLSDQNINILIGIGLMTASFVITGLITLMVYSEITAQRPNNFNRCCYMTLMVSVAFLLFTSGIILNSNLVKPIACPDYTYQSNLVSYGVNHTICVCTSKNGFQYTMLGINTLGYQCCDCPQSTSTCTNSPCVRGDPRANVIGIPAVIAAVIQVFVLLWLIT